jgi:alpha-tubulin suppressor-like RCC1 family protein
LIDLEDNVQTFGFDFSGQLGLGDRISIDIPTQIPNLKAQQVSAGNMYTVLIDLGSNIWAFGDNRAGELGLGYKGDRNIPTQIPHLKAYHVFAGELHPVIIATLVI